MNCKLRLMYLCVAWVRSKAVEAANVCVTQFTDQISHVVILSFYVCRYQFKLERWTNLGCSVLAAFASPEEDLTLLLHEAIGAMLKSCPRNGLRNKSCS